MELCPDARTASVPICPTRIPQSRSWIRRYARAASSPECALSHRGSLDDRDLQRILLVRGAAARTQLAVEFIASDDEEVGLERGPPLGLVTQLLLLALCPRLKLLEVGVRRGGAVGHAAGR